MHSLQQERIETARLALVPLDEETANAIMAGEASVVRHAEGWPHADTHDALRMSLRPERPWLVWLIVADGVVIGDCGTNADSSSGGEIDIGIGIAVECRNLGYGTGAVRALSGWLVRQPGVARVVAREVEVDNVPSRRMLERAEFVLEREGRGWVSYAFDPRPRERSEDEANAKR